jgi:hypothetical protein
MRTIRSCPSCAWAQSMGGPRDPSFDARVYFRADPSVAANDETLDEDEQRRPGPRAGCVARLLLRAERAPNRARADAPIRGKAQARASRLAANPRRSDPGIARAGAVRSNRLLAPGSVHRQLTIRIVRPVLAVVPEPANSWLPLARCSIRGRPSQMPGSGEGGGAWEEVGR